MILFLLFLFESDARTVLVGFFGYAVVAAAEMRLNVATSAVLIGGFAKGVVEEDGSGRVGHHGHSTGEATAFRRLEEL